METRSYVEELLELSVGLEGIPRDVDLSTNQNVFLDHEDRKTSWRVLFSYNDEIQVVESQMDPNADFPCHIHESVRSSKKCSETFMVREGSMSVILTDFADPIVNEISPDECYTVMPGKSHTVKAGEEGVRFFSVLFPASKGV